MIEEIFIRKATKLIHKIRLDYDLCKDTKDDIKCLHLLCHNFLELGSMENKEGNKNTEG